MSKKDNQCSLYWQKLLGQAKTSLIGASQAAMEVQLFEVLEEFFDGSNCWTEAIELVVIPNTLNYPVTPVQGGRILRLSDVIDQNLVAQNAVMPEIGTVTFVYTYTDSQPMTAIVVKTVSNPLECYPPNIPEWLLPQHGLVILNGILGKMMMQPGMSYSNPKLGDFYLRKFSDGISKAMVATNLMNKVGAQRWAFPQSFAVRGQRGGVSTFNVHPTPGRF
jgi:hypothetical protein